MTVCQLWCRLAIVVTALLAACHPDGPPAVAPPNITALRGTWLLLPEAGAGADTLVYRRNTYRFGFRAGGRPGFRLGEGGRFTRYVLAPGGGLLAQPGTWTAARAGRLRVVLPAPADTTYELQLLSYRAGELRLRPRPLQP